MKLYHVSYDRIPEFEPRIPQNRLPGEDSRVPRICLSTSVERCINAKPSQGQALYTAQQYGLRTALYIYEFDVNDIPTDKLIGPDELKWQFGVVDAKINGEHWLLDCAIPYRETRKEFVRGSFLPPDDRHPYAFALRLFLEDSHSALAKNVEAAVAKMNQRKTGRRITTDMVILALSGEIAAAAHKTQ